jgi:hypothetical protein
LEGEWFLSLFVLPITPLGTVLDGLVGGVSHLFSFP